MRFKDLAIGDLFEFDHTRLMFHTALAHGPWRKVSARKYCAAYEPGTRYAHRVGTTKITVVKAAENGQRYVSCGG